MNTVATPLLQTKGLRKRYSLRRGGVGGRGFANRCRGPRRISGGRRPRRAADQRKTAPTGQASPDPAEHTDSTRTHSPSSRSSGLRRLIVVSCLERVCEIDAATSMRSG